MIRGLQVKSVILCIAIVLCSCRPTPPSAKPSHEVYPAISALLRDLQGSWVSRDYKASLRKTLSPLRSASYIDQVFSFVIDSGDMRHDTIYLTALIRGQANNSLWIALGKTDTLGRYAAGQKVFAENDKTPGDDIVAACIRQGSVVLYTVESDSMRYELYDREYKARPADYMLQRYTTQVLFHGEYTTRDSGTVFLSSHISFDPDHPGRLLGSAVYDSFDINTDVLAQRDSFDYFELFDTRGASESHSYTYQIKGDKLTICPLTPDAPCCRLLRSDSLSR